MFQRLRPALPTIALLGLIVYFVFHGLTGERGLLLSSQRDAILKRTFEGIGPAAPTQGGTWRRGRGYYATTACLRTSLRNAPVLF
jgi:hypothetical protein